MTTKHYSNGVVLAQNIPYESPYEAFMNYMNVLSDFIERVNAQYPTSIENEELNALLKTIYNQGQEIEELKAKLKKTKKWYFCTPKCRKLEKIASHVGRFFCNIGSV